jgi:hypothetical protein
MNLLRIMLAPLVVDISPRAPREKATALTVTGSMFAAQAAVVVGPKTTLCPTASAGHRLIDYTGCGTGL